MLPPPCFRVEMVLSRWWMTPGFHQTWCLELRPKNVILVPSDQKIFLHSPLRVFWGMFFHKLQVDVNVPEEKILSGHSAIKLRLMECCSDGWPSGTFSHLLPSAHSHSGVQPQWSVGCCSHLLPKPFSPNCLVGQWSALGRVLPVLNFLHFTVMAAYDFFVSFSAAGFFFSPDLYLDILLFLSLEGFFCAHDLVFTLIASCETLYKQVYVFLSHVQSVEFTTGGLQSKCKNVKDDQEEQKASKA